MISLAKLRRKLLTNPEVHAAYDRLGPIFAVVREMIDARLAVSLTQADIAARMGTSQSVVARLGRARHMPTFDMMARYAAAIGRRIEHQRTEALARRESGELVTEIARRYNVSHSTISRLGLREVQSRWIGDLRE